MLFRLVALGIVIFWLGSIAWLCAVIWAPPESRMAKVDPREVFDVFFQWNDTTRMTLVENGKRRGQLSVSGSHGPEIDSEDIVNSISISLSLESFKPDIKAIIADAFFKLAVDFSEQMKFRKMDLSARVPSKGMTAHLEMGGDPMEYEVKAAMGEQELLNFKGAAGSGMPVLPLNMLPMGSFLGSGNFDPREMKWEIEARMGRFNFGGREQRAYLLIFNLPEQDQSVRIYLSEVGEPLQIETDIGFEAISEILVPIESYETGSPDTEDD